ncbi:MAG: DNA gyrase inhibitor YacG [Verrucomicrobiota bacterium]|jgi:endogenous inhibitor of DNA gyrase (YacG/DUF329 family)
MRPVKCPTCKKSGDWFAGKYGPFCSRRCKLIDLGKWISGENAISEPLRPEHFENYGGSLPGEPPNQPDADSQEMV